MTVAIECCYFISTNDGHHLSHNGQIVASFRTYRLSGKVRPLLDPAGLRNGLSVVRSLASGHFSQPNGLQRAADNDASRSMS